MIDASRATKRTSNGKPSSRLKIKNLARSVPTHLRPLEIRADPFYDASIEQYLRDVDRRLVPYMRQSIQTLSISETTLREAVEVQIHTGGKRIRAALCVLSCELFRGDHFEALPYAAAIEHIQNFSLIHDDIADADRERRSLPSLWIRYGVPQAINVGDAFIALALRSILSAPYPAQTKIELLEAATRFGLDMSTGQSIDLGLRQKERITLHDYLRCTRLKTGAFLAMAVVGGAIVGGAEQPFLTHLESYATLAGVAFQIKDDVLDLVGGKGRLPGSDVLEGKLTVHAARALATAEERECTRLREILQKRRRATSQQDVEWVIALYHRTGAVRFAERLAERVMTAAARHLLPLPDSPAKRRLVQLSYYLSRRPH
jgi:geranylgeranyl diphosphate synthase, type I